MIDLWVSLGLLASHAFAGTAPVLIYKAVKSNKVKREQIPLMANESVREFVSNETSLPKLALSNTFDVQSTEDKVNTVVMTDEQYLKHLCKLYPEAYKTYKSDMAEKRIVERSDRYVMRMILAAEAGDMDVKLSGLTMDFSNGDQVWIGNKYYSYGNLYRSEDNPHCVFSISNGTLSLYTFMRLVHLEETFFDPVLRMKNSTIKVVSPNA